MIGSGVFFVRCACAFFHLQMCHMHYTFVSNTDVGLSAMPLGTSTSIQAPVIHRGQISINVAQMLMTLL